MVHKDFTSLYVQQHDIRIAIYHIPGYFQGEIFHELANSNFSKGKIFTTHQEYLVLTCL